MNKQTLQNIANQTNQVSNLEIEEIKQLIGSHPFYPLPHVVLAKIYFEKEHYLFENALNQAAMRMNDREWLYHYIHGDEGFENTNDSSVPMAEISEALDDQHPAIDEVISLQNETEDSVISDEFLKNDLQAFLSDLAISEAVETIEEVNEEAAIEEEETIEQLQETPVQEEILSDLPSIALTTVVEGENTATEIETEAETIVEQAVEDTIEEESTIETIKEQLPDMDLRKYPVYNVESFLNEEKTTTNAELEASADKDFFYWLSHPKPAVSQDEVFEDVEEPAFTEDKTLSIIEQFIKANPSISRPKKEFYSAENMAKRSENVDFDYVTETLANIYYEQGNIDLAIKAYEKLSLQNPLKQTYFASLIEKIKKEKR
jgi:hypothetical protein